ncbi:uncharacterized protein [Paramormyrops kingsleyae]|uniref:uncharacterized protein n=1 Tax=Paramormyrops kingsleyae TaxID=1676925 RepID=UPI003B977A68
MKSLLIFSFFCICCILASPHAKRTSEQYTEKGSSLYEDLWKMNFNIVKDTLQTKFLQRMQDGSLPAELYLTFIVQDLYYLRNVTDMLQKMSMKEGMPQDLRLFFENRFKSYQAYTNSLFNMYALENQTIIHPQPAIVSYVNTYHEVMQGYEPIYFAVALLPCARLWAYLGQNLSITQKNAYYSFKRDNDGHDPSKHFKSLLDGHQRKIDKHLANSIFRKQMENEKSFFQSSMP